MYNLLFIITALSYRLYLAFSEYIMYISNVLKSSAPSVTENNICLIQLNNIKGDISDFIISTWQEYSPFIIVIFIMIIIIIILVYQFLAVREQKQDIQLKLNSRYNQIKNLESDTALLSNILKAVKADYWVINTNKNEIYYINDNNYDIKVVTGNNLKSCFTNYIHPDYQEEFIEKLNNCKTKNQKDFDITYLVHRKHSKHEYEWYWSRGIVTTRRDITGKAYLAISGITINIEALKRTQINFNFSENKLNELKSKCRTIRYDIAKRINENVRNRKELTKKLTDDSLNSKERKTIYKQIHECDKVINSFISDIHKSLK